MSLAALLCRSADAAAVKVCGVCTFPAAFCDAVPEGGAGASSLERAATGESFVSRFSMSART